MLYINQFFHFLLSIYIYMINNKKYYRYQMTFPFESNKIYKSRSLNKVVNKCYNEFKNFNDISDGMFGVTNIDKKIEHRFKIKNNKIKYHRGGNDNKINNQVEEILKLDDDKQNSNKNIIDITNILNLTNKNINSISTKIDNQDNKLNKIINFEQKLNTNNKQISNVVPELKTNEKKNIDKDLFYDIDVFDYNLKKLTAFKKINNLEHNNLLNFCIIL